MVYMSYEVTMKWYEITIKTHEMAIDAVCNLLMDQGAGGVAILDPQDPDFHNQDQGKWDYFDPSILSLDFDGVLITAYLNKDDINMQIQIIKEGLKQLPEFGINIGLGEVNYKTVVSSDWENEWKKYFKPFKIGDHMIVKPTWEDYDGQSDDIIIEIDPGNAFGSGTHETTSMCIKMIEKYMKPGDLVVDVGCGSGILSIAAGHLGASYMVGVDIDETAVDTAKSNLMLNGFDTKSDVRYGSLTEVVKERGNLIVANIIAEVIVVLLDDIEKIMTVESTFICSGIIVSKIEMVTQKLNFKNFEILEILKEGEWAAIVSKKVS